MNDATDLLILPRTTCRVCGSSDLTELFSLGEQYVSDFPRPGDPLPPRVPITLDLCNACTLVQQRYTAPQDFLYTRHYWYRSGTTNTMRRALADVVDAAMSRVRLDPGDVVLDVGSNDGTLLRQYPKELGLVTVGVEPATNLAEEGRKGVSVFVPGFWPQDVGCVFDGKCKVVTACGMFYDLEDPNAFVAGVARVLHPDGVFVAQLMCLKQTVQLGDVGNFAHEHLEFYSLLSLTELFRRHGLEVEDVEENAVNGGSYRLFVRHEKNLRTLLATSGTRRLQKAWRVEEDMGLKNPATYRSFFQEMVRNRDECVAFLNAQIALDKEIWVYGASTKGNVIAQWYGFDRDSVTGAADRSPEKHGREMVGTRIPIFSEELMRRSKPDFCVVLPYAFLNEFVDRESGYSWRKDGGKFVVPLPQFKVV